MSNQSVLDTLESFTISLTNATFQEISLIDFISSFIIFKNIKKFRISFPSQGLSYKSLKIIIGVLIKIDSLEQIYF